MRLHHVQVSCPPGGEDVARRFWVDGLAMTEVAKPVELDGRGGAWFRSYDDAGAVIAEVHVGVEAGFVPARRAHPALLVDDVAQLDEVAARLEALDHDVDRTERTSYRGFLRVHVRDGHGNRVELLAALSAPAA